jgi:Ser/Thr protein kinase RdoA (MazF antagonist)
MDPAYARAAFGWDEAVEIVPGPRGALGRIWRVRTGYADYALKELFSDPPSEAVIRQEQAFAAAARIAAGHKSRTGHYAVAAPDGAWLRAFEWIDLRPVDLENPATPADLGVLLARLHRYAPKATAEVAGGPPDPWYDTVLESDYAVAEVTRADPAEMVLCHRDLHPENVLADPSGALVVVDWDLLGPATPSRELARALFDWYCDPEPDLPAMRALYRAYVKEGGPGRVERLDDFSMLIATRCNFLQRQQRIARDPRARKDDREWAEREVAEGLRMLPNPGQLAAVLAMARGAHHSPGGPS